MNEHTTTTVTIRGQDVEIDDMMVPVVTWLNGLTGVRTTYCCEGRDNDPCHKPYVLFYCTDVATLRHIIDALSRATNAYSSIAYAECILDWLDDWRYCLRFHNKNMLRLFNHDRFTVHWSELLFDQTWITRSQLGVHV